MTGCPKCGGVKGYTVKVRASGTVVHQGEWDVPGGHERIIGDDNLSFMADKTVKCVECGKRTLTKRLRVEE